MLRRFESPGRANHRCGGETHTKGPKSSFELIQRFTVLIRQIRIADRSEDKVDIKKYNSLISISDKYSIVGYRMA
jgi:hypothetical protein